jgi:hypothetical protein
VVVQRSSADVFRDLFANRKRGHVQAPIKLSARFQLRMCAMCIFKMSDASYSGYRQKKKKMSGFLLELPAAMQYRLLIFSAVFTDTVYNAFAWFCEFSCIVTDSQKWHCVSLKRCD